MEELYKSLIQSIAEHKAVVVAFSGGVDSSLVLKLAADSLGHQNVIAATSHSDSLPENMLNTAQELARDINVRHEILYTQELQNEEYRKNSHTRCFHCKSELYNLIRQNFKDKTILNGTNLDDLQDFRPGLEAAKKFSVISPLADSRLDKKSVRALAKFLKLRVWDTPASPCLASRIPYGQRVSSAKLRQIEQAESFLRSKGFTDFRVRHYGNLAKLEVSPKDILRFLENPLREEIVSILKKIGFRSVSLDLEGFRSGKLNG